jgi:23S rRNA pseudouridine1911/1915/1917 synthase
MEAGSPVIYADERLIVLNKPSGVPSVPLARDSRPSAVALALEHHPELAKVGEAVGKPMEAGLLHRLDTGTSGLLAFARTQEAYEELKRAWKTKAVTKTYRALVSGEPPFPNVPLAIDKALGRSAKSAKRMLVVTPAREYQLRGKPLEAHTEIHRATRVEYGACLRQLNDVEVTIRTGVMHQIRAHMASIGWPLLGDKIYKGDTSERLWLHAWKLKLPAPGGPLELTAPLPATWPA